MTDLRDRIADALTREHHRRAAERIEASPEEHQAAFADVVMGVVQPELDRLTEQAEQATKAAAKDIYIKLGMDALIEWKHRADQAEDRNRTISAAYDRVRAEADDNAAARDRWKQRVEAAEYEHRKLAGINRDLQRAEIDLKRENEQLREQVRQYGGLAEQHQQIGDL